MWRLGADLEGYAANFVESKQIVQSTGYTTSYVQVSFFRHTNNSIMFFILVYVLIVFFSWFCVVKIISLTTLNNLWFVIQWTCWCTQIFYSMKLLFCDAMFCSSLFFPGLLPCVIEFDLTWPWSEYDWLLL
jgi:hypothetical protein